MNRIEYLKSEHFSFHKCGQMSFSVLLTHEYNVHKGGTRNEKNIASVPFLCYQNVLKSFLKEHSNVAPVFFSHIKIENARPACWDLSTLQPKLPCRQVTITSIEEVLLKPNLCNQVPSLSISRLGAMMFQSSEL